MHDKIYPKTNISKAYYRHLVRQILHDPLIRPTSLAAACMIAAASVLAGMLIWFAQSNPGNLLQTNATITGISSGRTSAIGTITTFLSFDFTTHDGQSITARQAANDGLLYQEGQSIKVGYHPRNPYYVRNLNDNRPPASATVFWATPFIIIIWLGGVALFRHRQRQLLLWDAADAANSDD